MSLSPFLPLAAVTGAQQPVPDRPDTTHGDVVVTARSDTTPVAEPVDYLRRYCFDPMRLTGAPALPESDPDWVPLDEDMRREFGVTDPSVAAYGLRDDPRGRTLLLKVELLPAKWRTVENRCTLVAIGGGDLAHLRNDMSALMRAAATERHVGAPGGTPALPGWRQWLWSGMPSRRFQDWRALKRDGRGSESAWLHVLEPEFYAEHDHIVADMKLKRDATRSVAVLTFSRIHRPRYGASPTDGRPPKKKGGPERPPSD